MIIDQFQKSERFFEKPLDKSIKVCYNIYTKEKRGNTKCSMECITIMTLTTRSV
jgi:hypothetical protein